MGEQSVGVLYLVATPIGNLEDMTFRAVRILQDVEVIAAEDTRRTGKLLQHFQITTPTFSYHQHNHQARVGEIVQRLQHGAAIALVTDAGMPGISDPGTELVQACVAANISVMPIPGATAAIAALAAAGLSTEQFVFEGFLPSKEKARRERLQALAHESRTLVFYEAPHRLGQTLQELAATLGNGRNLVFARELTKLHEEFWRGTLAEAIAHCRQRPPKGEFTLVVAGAPKSQGLPLSEAQIKEELQTLLQQGLSKSQASQQLARSLTLSRREIYQLALALPSPKVQDHPD